MATAIARREGEKREGRKQMHQVTADGPGREGRARGEILPNTQGEKFKEGQGNKKLPHHHSQETALPLTCDPKNAFSDP